MRCSHLNCHNIPINCSVHKKATWKKRGEVEGEEKGDILRTVKGEREAGEERKMRTEIVTRQTDQRQGK
jgi:hypothetical protein